MKLLLARTLARFMNNLRLLYNVEEQVQIVEIKRIGEKEGNTFLFRGQQEDV